MVEKIDRSTYGQGMGNEILTRTIPKVLSPSIVATIDIGRFLKAEQVEGANIAFILEGIVVASSNKTMIRIPVKEGKTIYVRGGSFSVTPSDGANVPDYRIIAGSVLPSAGTTIVKKLHWSRLRRTTSMTIGAAISEGQFGEFAVPQGLEYIIRIENGVGSEVTGTASVEAFYLPVGVNGSKC